jgi:SAM-dependent methyltransferase
MSGQMADDSRAELYRALHQQHTRDEATRIYSARRVLEIVQARVGARSVLDVGCGRGIWMSVARDLGANDVRGVEGPWLDPKQLAVDPSLVTVTDLEKPFDLGAAFDLVVSIEVAEHLSPAAAQTFVQSLVRHGKAVLFSAAIPFQPGTGHINPQFLDYWAGLFRAQGYVPLDIVRGEIWTDRGIHVWIRQNVVLFVSKEHPLSAATVSESEGAKPLSLVHPELYVALLRQRSAGLA